MRQSKLSNEIRREVNFNEMITVKNAYIRFGVHLKLDNRIETHFLLLLFQMEIRNWASNFKLHTVL